MSNPRILVLGAGGIGGYFGGRLVESGADVTFLVREGRRKILSERGLQIESPFGDAQLAVETVVASDLAPIYDAVILTCKAYDLDTAVAAIAPAVAPTGYVLPFLNGIAHIDVLNQKFGQGRVLGGTAKIQSTLTSNGAIRQFNDWRTLTFGLAEPVILLAIALPVGAAAGWAITAGLAHVLLRPGTPVGLPATAWLAAARCHGLTAVSSFYGGQISLSGFAEEPLEAVVLVPSEGSAPLDI